MQAVTTIGFDIAKSVFQVHGVDTVGQVIIRRQLKRRQVIAFFQKLPACLVGIEACASSHYWSRELQALGHNVRLTPAYVRPYVKRQKNDMADAEAICEAVTRANMRFVATKTPEQQSCLTLHRTRHLFIRQQTSVINAIRAQLAEFGIVAPILTAPRHLALRRAVLPERRYGEPSRLKRCLHSPVGTPRGILSRRPPHSCLLRTMFRCDPRNLQHLKSGTFNVHVPVLLHS